MTAQTGSTANRPPAQLLTVLAAAERLGLARALGQFGKIFVTELADGFVNFLIVELG